MKRFLLFGFDRYYPSGGLNDLIVTFDDVSEIDWDELDFKLERQYYQLLDMDERKQTGLSPYWELEQYELEHGDLEDDEQDEFRLKILKEFVSSSVK